MTTNAEIPRFSCNDRESEMFKAIEETGVVIVEDLIDQDAVDAILTETEARLRRVDPAMIHINEVLQGFYAGPGTSPVLPASHRRS